MRDANRESSCSGPSRAGGERCLAASRGWFVRRRQAGRSAKLRIIDRKRLAPGEEVSRWIDEARQLLAILIASARTARERANRDRTPVSQAQRNSRGDSACS